MPSRWGGTETREMRWESRNPRAGAWVPWGPWAGSSSPDSNNRLAGALPVCLTNWLTHWTLVSQIFNTHTSVVSLLKIEGTNAAPLCAHQVSELCCSLKHKLLMAHLFVAVSSCSKRAGSLHVCVHVFDLWCISSHLTRCVFVFRLVEPPVLLLLPRLLDLLLSLRNLPSSTLPLVLPLWSFPSASSTLGPLECFPFRLASVFPLHRPN